MPIVPGVAHDRHDLVNRRRVRRIPHPLVARRTSAVVAGHVAGERRRRATSSTDKSVMRPPIGQDDGAALHDRGRPRLALALGKPGVCPSEDPGAPRRPRLVHRDRLIVGCETLRNRGESTSRPRGQHGALNAAGRLLRAQCALDRRRVELEDERVSVLAVRALPRVDDTRYLAALDVRRALACRSGCPPWD